MNNKKVEIFTVVVLGDLELGLSDMGGCLTVSCTNKRSLAEITGLPYDRLVYVFTRLGRNVLVEDGNLIIRTNHLYKGKQAGRINVPSYSGYNRNV